MTHLHTLRYEDGDAIVEVRGPNARRIHAALTALDLLEGGGDIWTSRGIWFVSDLAGGPSDHASNNLVAALLNIADPSERSYVGGTEDLLDRIAEAGQ